MKVVNKVKYYVKLFNSPKLAINVYKTDDGKYHRFIAVISDKVNFRDKGKYDNVKVIVSPKKLVTEYLNEYADAWVNNDFKTELPKKFNQYIQDIVERLLTFNYGMRALDQISPVRYESDVKLTDWEFRMFHKPERV